MRELFTFDDVLIVPKFSKIASRKDVDISINIRSLTVGIPVISSNMDTITGIQMAQAMQDIGSQACLHRFTSIEDNVQMFKASMLGLNGLDKYDGPMVSIGLGSKELERAEALHQAGAHTLVVDVAHGAQLAVANQVKSLRDLIGPYANIIVGNFATGDSVREFLDYVGKSSLEGIKVGIGPGSACITRLKTGVGYPQLSAVMDVAQTLKNTGITVIADGGLKTPGDIAKAIGAGANLAMIGGMLAGTYETPGKIVQQDGLPCNLFSDGVYKKYRGSASKESYEVQGKDASWRTAEGESFLVPYKGPVKEVLQDIEGGLRSAMTYVGASNIAEFHSKCEFVRISSSTVAEGLPHGKK